MRSAPIEFSGARWPKWRGYYEYLTKFTSLSMLTGARAGELKGYWREAAHDRGFRAELEEPINEVLKEGVRSESIGAIPSARTNVALYTVIRAIKPETVIETGVGTGISTSYILKALGVNHSGVLHSIDLPNTSPEGYVYKDGLRDPVALPPGKEPGWIIPKTLRGRWRLHIGKSADILPGLLDELGEIDFFFHDSEHSYGNMLFEFRQAWRALRPSGILMSDDIHWNDAFKVFAETVEREPALLFYRGGLRK